MGDDGNRRVRPDAMQRFLHQLFVAAGAPEGNATAVVDHLVESSRVGLHSHGVLRAPEYLDLVHGGAIDPAAEPRIERESGAFAVLDAARCFGQVAGQRACDEATARADATDAPAMVAVRRAAHLGRIGAYADTMARRGFVALVFCSVPTRFHNVAWFGTRTGRLGTNPIAYGIPTTGEPVVADFATSATAEGKVRFLRNEGLRAPEGVLRDSQGRPTTDPTILYEEPRGTLQPLGGEYGYKGSALGMLVEVMATLLAGERADDPTRDNNLAILTFRAPAGLAGLVEGLVEHLHAAAPIDTGRPPLVPGELEHRTRAATDTILVDPVTWSRLVDHANTRGVELPAASS
jgi:uncharacterized oxidoreductase